MKYDRCNIPLGDFPGESEEQVQQTLYDAHQQTVLKASGRPIVFSMCNPDPGDDPWEWGAPISNLWRTTTDIQDNFGSMLANFEGTVGRFRDAGPGAWNDPDMLQIGNGGSSLHEYTSQFSLWAEMAAPLIASTEHRSVDEGRAGVYENPYVVAVDQDPLGRPGVPISSANGLWVLTKSSPAAAGRWCCSTRPTPPRPSRRPPPPRGSRERGCTACTTCGLTPSARRAARSARSCPDAASRCSP